MLKSTACKMNLCKLSNYPESHHATTTCEKNPKIHPQGKRGRIFLSLQTKQKRISMQKNNLKEAHQGRLEKRNFLEGKIKKSRQNNKKPKNQKQDTSKKSWNQKKKHEEDQRQRNHSKAQKWTVKQKTWNTKTTPESQPDARFDQKISLRRGNNQQSQCAEE